MANIVKARNSSFIDFDYIFENKSDAASGDVNKAIGGDVLINTTGERINTAMWDTGDTTLGAGEYFTQSTQAGTSGEYYLDVFRANPDTDSTQVPQFSVAYGNYDGYGETGLEGQSQELTPTKAIYSQYAALLEDKNSTDSDFKFDISGSTDSIYIVNIGRNQLKERADAGNWEMKISGSTGVFTFIDKLVGSGSNDLSDGPIDIVSGSITNGIAASPGFTSYGKFYPNYGVLVFHAGNIASTTGLTETKTLLHYDDTANSYTAQTTMLKTNPLALFDAIKGGAHFKARSMEHLHSRTYFCRIPSHAGNFSSNPTYIAANSNDGSFRHISFIGNPKSYVTTVGLYDESNELLAVAKLSKPLLKSFSREALVRVRLEY